MPNNPECQVLMMRCIINPDQTPNNWVPGWKGFFDINGDEYELIVIRDADRKVYVCMLISHEQDPVLTTSDGRITYFCSTTPTISNWISNVLHANITLQGENKYDF